MTAATGIELGPDSCVVAGVRTGLRGPAVFALHVIEPGEWPRQDVTLSGRLRSVRRNQRLPRTARVVAWGFHEAAQDPVTSAALRPVVEAGFRIDVVLSPPQALARLAASRPRGGGAVAWLALNMSGVAIAIVRDGELLFERTFDWSFTPGAADPRTELLQRYSLVMHLAPELQRGIAMVKASHGIAVATAITCGDLPDLRSLTMPLIEELDLEVETLDSMDGLRVTGAATSDRLTELAPAVRLACAAAISPSQRRGAAPFAGIAAGAVLVAALGWGGYAYWTSAPRIFSKAAPTPAARATPVPPAIADPASPKPPAATPAVAPVPEVPVPFPPAVAQPSVRLARPPQQVRRSPADTTRGSPVPVPTSGASLRRPMALEAPLPVIESILVDANRRLAVIGGAIVSVGDSVGPRTVTQIEHDFVVLREPSGLEVRVPLRGRVSELAS